MRRDVALVGGLLVLAGTGLTLWPDLTAGASTGLSRRLLAVLGTLVAILGVATVVLTPAPAHSPGTDTDAPADSGDAASRAADAPGSGAATERGARPIGGEFDAALARIEAMSATQRRRADEPAAVRARLRAAVVATVARERGLERGEATAVVERGDWTDDPVAAAYVSRSRRVPVGHRARELVSTTPAAVTRARRTAAVLEARP